MPCAIQGTTVKAVGDARNAAQKTQGSFRLVRVAVFSMIVTQSGISIEVGPDI
eukprot:m.1154165 g.1154165  ORF g.1154165 m.1154165 type:complete len:53 (-) comp24488_c0_seq11:2237-2395(-)